MLLFLGKYTEEEQQETQDSELCTIHSEKAFIIYDESFFYDIIIMEVDKYARKLK